MARSKFKAGDLVLVPFSAPARDPGALSPALILLSWPWGDHANHHLVCLVDTESSIDPYEMALTQDDVLLGQIPQTLYIRPTYVMTVSDSRIKTHIAALKPESLVMAVDALDNALYEDIEDQNPAG